MSPIIGVIDSAKTGNLITNDFYYLASATGTGSTLSVSSIPSTYKNLRIYYTARTNAGSSPVDNLVMSFNSDTTASNYKGWYWGSGTTSTSPTTIFPLRSTASTATTDYFGAGWVDILDYSSTSNSFKQVQVYASSVSPQLQEIFINYTAWVNSATAINSVQIGQGAGSFITGSKLDIYAYN